MTIGQIINGYKITQEFTTTGGGLCRWTFAEKNGKTFFLKEFLHPKYPTPESPGGPKTKERKATACKKFEDHHNKLRTAIADKVGAGGNLVATIDFFRNGTTYYKVTEKVDTTSSTIPQISKLPLQQRLLILKTVAHSVSILHQLSIVHGDIKPENILIKKTSESNYIAKLIDFDNSYFSSKPPDISDEDDIVGDPTYYSPELGLYIKRHKDAKPTDLTTQSDIFALGLVFSQYLTGILPDFKSELKYAWVAANNGDTVIIRDKDIPPLLKELVNSMLQKNLHSRPSIDKVFQTLKSPDIIKTSITKLDTATTRSGLSGKLLKPVKSGLSGKLAPKD